MSDQQPLDANARALIEIAGPDAEDFLHRMSTNRIKDLKHASEPGGACEARATLFLRGDGRLVASCWIACPEAGRYVVSTHAGAKDGLLEHLDRFLIMEKVEVQDLSSQWECWPFLHDKKASPLIHLTYSESDTSRNFDIISAPHVLGRREIWLPAGVKFRDVDTGEISTRLDAPHFEHIEGQRILAHEPAWGAELTTNTIPLEAGLKHAIDFAKGCFPGQEIVARIENLGHPANVLVGLSSDAELVSGQQLFADQKQVGRITSVTRRFQPLSTALGFVKWDHRVAGTKLQAGSPDGPETVVSEWPDDLH